MIAAAPMIGPPADPRPEARPVDEALLYVEWARAAGGRYQGRDDAAPSARSSAGLEAAPVPVAPPAAAPFSAVPGIDDGPPGADPFDRLRADALACRRCGLCETRTTVVFGEGSRTPRLMVVGEAPGADEDATGRPFVGKAGQLLTRMLAAIGLSREDVYIANVLKCRPPENRPPRPDEAASCRPYLQEQIRLLAPELILVLGNHAAKALLGTDRGITSLRGRVTSTPEGVPALPTFHPAYLLRNPPAKREAWIDLQLAAKTLGLALPAARSE
jgi:DNA polymerase